MYNKNLTFYFTTATLKIHIFQLEKNKDKNWI